METQLENQEVWIPLCDFIFGEIPNYFVNERLGVKRGEVIRNGKSNSLNKLPAKIIVPHTDKKSKVQYITVAWTDENGVLQSKKLRFLEIMKYNFKPKPKLKDWGGNLFSASGTPKQE